MLLNEEIKIVITNDGEKNNVSVQTENLNITYEILNLCLKLSENTIREHTVRAFSDTEQDPEKFENWYKTTKLTQ